MSPHYDYPGVYIEEVTGLGVIAGVGTSTAGFVGPALAGPLGAARRITTFDDFVRMYGGTRDGRPWPYLYTGSIPYHLAFAVEGFFRNGGTQAFVVRVGTARQAKLVIRNQKPEGAFVVRALEEGTPGNALRVTIEPVANLTVATGSATLAADPDGATLTVDSGAPFRIGDAVTAGAAANRSTIIQIQNDVITLDAPFAGAADSGDTLRIADIPNGSKAPFRLVSTESLTPGATVLVKGSTRTVIETVNAQTGFVNFKDGSPAKYVLTTTPPPWLVVVRALATAKASVGSSAQVKNALGEDVTSLTLSSASVASAFLPGDTVTCDGTHTAMISRVEGSKLILASKLTAPTGTVKLALLPGQTTFRVDRGVGLSPGSTLRLDQGDRVVVSTATASGLVTIQDAPAITNTYDLSVAAASAPVATAEEFRLVVTSSTTSGTERIEGLSLNPSHPRYVLGRGVIGSDWVELAPPDSPVTAAIPPATLVDFTTYATAQPLTGGIDDAPENLTSVHYQAGLNVLRDVDDVSIVAIPDAAAHAERQAIQQAQIDHCLAAADRFAILDSAPGAEPNGPGSVEEQRAQVTADRGYAALYYPWLVVRDPTSSGPAPRTMTIPPSGAIAGIYARTDQERGVHKAPANTDVRGALGLEQRLSDRLQGPLNLEGVNVLRIFPGAAQVVVWGARTTVQPDVTDWLYVNVRRLLLYIEESIQEGIRAAVFAPNDLALWQQLNRTIRAFLTSVWKDGGLFGATAAEAFEIRIDEGLNPPSERALGRLHIEIKVAPVRPAEFIIVRIGLWDGGGDVSES
jgi:phage tail sheath protein FI